MTHPDIPAAWEHIKKATNTWAENKARGPRAYPRTHHGLAEKLLFPPQPAIDELGFPSPIVFFRRPDFGTPEGGVSDIAPLMVTAGVKAVAVDRLIAKSWGQFETVMAAHGLPVYSWSRLYGRTSAALLSHSPGPFVANIEDDDLRAAQPAPGGINGFLSYVREILNPVAVLTNYNVSDLWPPNHPLSGLPVGPLWFPREITDPSATLAGSLASGKRHFRTAFPVYDGRDSGPSGPWPRAGVWVGDDVQRWRDWA